MPPNPRLDYLRCIHFFLSLPLSTSMRRSSSATKENRALTPYLCLAGEYEYLKFAIRSGTRHGRLIARNSFIFRNAHYLRIRLFRHLIHRVISVKHLRTFRQIPKKNSGKFSENLRKIQGKTYYGTRRTQDVELVQQILRVSTGEEDTRRRRSQLEQNHYLRKGGGTCIEGVSDGVPSFSCKETLLTHVIVQDTCYFDTFQAGRSPIPGYLFDL